MALPYRTTGSLKPTFVSARLVGLAVNLVYAFALVGLISKQPEPTFERLRYSLGGYRPSKTSRLPLSLRPIEGKRLVIPISKGGVSLSAQRPPKGPLQSLPLTLSIKIETTVTACSKGA